MPTAAGSVARVDLGTKPESNADAMMEGGKIATLLYRIVGRCAEREQLPSEGTVVLRFGISGDGILLDAQGDPPEAGGACLAEALAAEKDALGSLPAGAALARLQLQAASPPSEG